MKLSFVKLELLRQFVLNHGIVADKGDRWVITEFKWESDLDFDSLSAPRVYTLTIAMHNVRKNTEILYRNKAAIMFLNRVLRNKLNAEIHEIHS